MKVCREKKEEKKKKPYFTIKWVKNFLKKVKTFPSTVRKVGNEKAVQDCVWRYEISSLKHLSWISALISRLVTSRRELLQFQVLSDSLGENLTVRFDIFLFGHGKLRVQQRIRCLRMAKLVTSRDVCRSDKHQPAQPMKVQQNIQARLSSLWEMSIVSLSGAAFITPENRKAEDSQTVSVYNSTSSTMQVTFPVLDFEGFSSLFQWGRGNVWTFIEHVRLTC